MTDLTKLSDAELLALAAQHTVAGGGISPEVPKTIFGAPAKYMQGGWGSGIENAAYNAGGAVTDLAAKVLPPEAAAGVGYAANVGMQSIPALFGGRMAQEAVAPSIQQGAKNLMQSAVKPTIRDLRTGKAERAIQTLLDEGVNPTKSGMATLRTEAGAITPQVDALIANSGATIPKGSVARPVVQVLQNARNQVNPVSDMQAVRNAWNEFSAHPDLSGTNDIPVALAQQLKKGTYQQIADKYGEMGSATTEAQKALARGLKEGISNAVPEVAALNKRQSDLFNALNVSERRTLMQENVNPMSLAWLARNPAAAIGFLADKSALVKSLVARMLYSGSNAIPYAAGAGAGAIVGAQSGLAPTQQQMMSEQMRGK